MVIIQSTSLTIIDFNKKSNLLGWIVVDDVVMGGQSNGDFSLNKEGYAVFSGTVSTANKGGFSSLRHRFDKLNVSKFETIKIRVKGDGNKYQFRVKPNQFNQFSYTTYFQTTTEWETIEIKLTDLIPTFRGRILEMDNFDGKELEEIGFLIGNKKDEEFKLIIDLIILE
ncbi:CIA30 family protein [Lutibacter holmesii]|uniref:CIA30 family protein n=1 Tax=Lutibacter holmesii TaxID=1137985 RepID=A0ABW3WRK6_9FLAO